mgnify:CR=1 FL=1
MVTIEHELDNPFFQDFYDKVISSIQFHQLSCTCGHCACLVRHGAYLRTVKVGDRLLAHGIFLLPLPLLVRRCFRCFSRPFLQIKISKNLLFILPT